MLGRRRFLGAVGIAALSACSKKETPAKADMPAPRVLPPMPEAGAAPAPRGEVGTQTMIFGEDARAVVVVPSWIKAGEKLPVLIALHGRGEAAKGPEGGALGWVHDYALLRAIDRMCKPPLTSADYEGFVTPSRLAEVNRELEAKPFAGLVVVCPYLPDFDLGKTDTLADYARYLFETVLPRVHKELPALASPAATGIDGVSLGGAAALRVGLTNADRFGAVGTLQAAIRGGDQIAYYTELARAARAKNPKLALRLLTSKDDVFHEPIVRTSEAWKAAGIDHDFLDVPGPHDYPFNRGPGAIEMLLWHDRKLARA